MNEKEKAAICLHCTKEECLGELECFKEQKKLYQKNYYASRRRAIRTLNYAYNKAQAEEYREKRNAVLKKHREGIENGKD